MNEGGSVLGGNQSTSGGTDAPILPNQNPSLDQATPQSSSPTPTSPNIPIPTSEPTDLPIDSSFDSLDAPSYNESSPADDPYTQEFMASLQSPDSVVEDKSKKPKKGLIIAILLAAVALIVISVVAFLSFSNSSSPSPTPVIQTSEPYVANFYSYANNLLYGTDSTDPLPNQEDEQYYTYEQHIYNGPDSDQNYINDIYENYLTFYNSIPSSNTALHDIATDYKDLLDFLRINPSSDNYNYNSVIETYLSRGKSSAEQAVNRNLSRIPDNQYSKDFREAKEEELNNTLEYMEALDEAGCIKNKTADEECALNLEIEQYPNDDENPYKIAARTNSETYDMLNEYYDQIGSDCWKIKEALEVNNS